MAEWGERAPSPVNLLHFAFSLGALLAPPTVAPFLSKTINNSTTGENKHFLVPEYHITPPVEVLPFSSKVGNSSEEEKNRIVIPFGFHGAVGVCGGLLFLGYYFTEFQYQATTTTSPGGTAAGTLNPAARSRTFRILMAISMFFIYVGIITRDLSISRFVFYIAVKSRLDMSKRRAAILNTANNGSWVLGRLLGTILAKFVRIHAIVFTGILSVLALTLSLVFSGFQTELTFWCLTCAVSLFAGPCYPSVMAWADRYVEMDGIMVAVVDVGIGAGAIFAQYYGAYLIHHRGPVYAFILSSSGAGFLLTVLVVVQIVCYRRGHRYQAISLTVNVSVDEQQTGNEPLIK